MFSLHSNFTFLPERKKIRKYNKLICNIQDKEKYVVQIRALKQALNHGLILKRVHRVIQFNQKALLKPYINMNTDLRKNAKNLFEKDFFQLMNNSVFGKTMENVRKHTDSFVINIFTEDFFEDWFDASNYDENDKRLLQIGVNEN